MPAAVCTSGVAGMARSYGAERSRWGRVMPAAVCTSGVARMARSYGAERSLLGAGDAGGRLHVRGRGHGPLLRG